MATSKKRINITVDDKTLAALDRLAAAKHQSISRVGVDLIEQALELQEDIHFSRVADKRLESKNKRIPHDQAWD